MTEKHTIHLANGSRVEVVGNTYAVYLAKPLTFRRSELIRHFTPEREVERLVSIYDFKPFIEALEASFRAVPQVVHKDSDDD